MIDTFEPLRKFRWALSWMLNGIHGYVVENFKILKDRKFEFTLKYPVVPSAANDIMECFRSGKEADYRLELLDPVGEVVHIVHLDNAKVIEMHMLDDDGNPKFIFEGDVGEKMYKNECKVCQSVMYSRDTKSIDYCSQECLNQFTFIENVISQPFQSKGSWKITSHQVSDGVHNITALYITPPIDMIEIDFVISDKCECGAEKCKTTHSDWCPKYK